MGKKSAFHFNQRGNKAVVSLLVLILVALVGIIATLFIMNRDNKSASTNQPVINEPSTPPPAQAETEASVKELVSFTVPSGMTEHSCSTGSNMVVLSRGSGSPSNCDATQPSPAIRISRNAESPKDCNEIQDVQNVSKHVCKSIFVDGKKTLEALTEYNQDSVYGAAARHAHYYLDTGKGVVKASVLVSPPEDGEELQPVLQQVVQSMKVK